MRRDGNDNKIIATMMTTGEGGSCEVDRHKGGGSLVKDGKMGKESGDSLN